ncbi:uncharacterized protein LOC108958043 [Eucalyptus grandis]|uniref:Uncharacterized protein n=3 Tax=Eucalyptus TaxID=3932 RepID=A0ACC3LBT3_EUCGR|nr:uncharacterized protein LOC108958043 [Eucalyptus grandis]KAK3436205.1 hypothetical protein EUGRSUZ_C00835 [Eucalyptus grandis]
MASTSAVSMATPLTRGSPPKLPSSDAFVKPLPVVVRPSRAVGASAKFQVRASLKEKAIAGATAAALTASMLVPEAAEAAVSPSLKNFLLSIVAGGVVLGAIIGAVVGVSNFDPVKRT